MYGTCETLCRLLSELYPAETPLNLIVWSPEDIEALAGGMECVVSEQDIKAVLERMDAIPEDQRLESGVSAGAVMDLIDEVKEAVPGVLVPAACDRNPGQFTAVCLARSALSSAGQSGGGGGL